MEFNEATVQSIDFHTFRSREWAANIASHDRCPSQQDDQTMP